ncbi:MAG TPA: hypothetical protein DCS66_15365 [Flavobacteriaceae bacterium]|nr:hypothetical protein [Flavobacteriaceae bacterium]|tara:strand:+ start:833 stop:1072 length:240 start_codon:yes stop_codon:yes gene_type:complete
MSDLKNSYAVHFGKTYYYKEREAVLTGKRKPDPMYHRIRNFGSYSKAKNFYNKICDRFLDRNEDIYKGITFCYLEEADE